MDERLAGTGLAAMIAGGYTFVLMFFLGGLDSVPRRFASYATIPYPDLAERAAELARWGAVGGSVFLVGALVFCVSLVAGRRRAAGTDA